VTTRNVHIDEALRTPQFYLLWMCLFTNVSAGIGILAVAKTMVSDIFGSSLPHVVDGAFAASYVSMVSVANMGGRLAWAGASDYLGRKATFGVFFGCGVPLYASVPFTASLATTSGDSLAPLVVFTSSTMLMFTMYGGGFATVPAYLADLFGTKYVGGIHGRLLTAWAAAGVLGPVGITFLRKMASERAMSDLTQQIDSSRFEATFGLGKEHLATLIESNTVTISKLMELVPPGTSDPTPLVYTDTMNSCAALLAVGFTANALIRPVHESHYMPDDPLREADVEWCDGPHAPTTFRASLLQRGW